MSVLSKPCFHDEAAAFGHVESILWPDSPVCPHCGGTERVYDLGKTRIGLKKCGHCRKQFTVRVDTIFEDSHLPMHKWLQAIHLVCSSRKGISAHQLHRVLEVTYKTAWFLEHRIREAMRTGGLSPMGGAGKPVEVDETYVGKIDAIGGEDNKMSGTRGDAFKNVVLTLGERGGSARSFHVDSASVNKVLPILNANLHRETALMTDSAALIAASPLPAMTTSTTAPSSGAVAGPQQHRRRTLFDLQARHEGRLPALL